MSNLKGFFPLARCLDLARNFDSVLYPDICKLTDAELRDAYGQVQPLPPSNMFVAGTSCKNFSMLRANKRLDIEEKGCSGETFLAAVEHIFKDQPPFCILENVQNAPWDKMAEYIEGKIKLSSCDDKKAIQGAKKGAKQELEFSYEGGKIIVDKVITCNFMLDECSFEYPQQIKFAMSAYRYLTYMEYDAAQRWLECVGRGSQDLGKSNGLPRNQNAALKT